SASDVTPRIRFTIRGIFPGIPLHDAVVINTDHTSRIHIDKILRKGNRTAAAKAHRGAVQESCAYAQRELRLHVKIIQIEVRDLILGILGINRRSQAEGENQEKTLHKWVNGSE